MDVFISHSSKDATVAEAVVKLLRAALDLAPSGIRCTSVAGYKLPLGADTDEQLKREVSDSKVFVAILTPTSIKSPYVVFEMGARWGKGLFIGPLLARGVTMKDIGPVSAINTLHATKEPDLHQFLVDVGQQLARPVNNAAAYLSELRAVIVVANEPVTT